jgi:hypothetical protein
VSAAPAGVPGSPVGWSERLGRRIRTDGPATLGVSTQTLAEQALRRGDLAVAADLVRYFCEEMTRIDDAVLTWLVEILAARTSALGPGREAALDEAARVVAGLASFAPGGGDLEAALAAIADGDTDTAARRTELMRVRIAAVHDLLVWWVQHLLTDTAQRHGEGAVRDVVVTTYDSLWSKRYADWPQMTALERLQLSVEGMRGHLSGPGHRGDVGIEEDEVAYRMVLDPCGSCGVLRRGDPDSGRAPCAVAGTREPHDWAYGRIGLGWYAVHSAIVMEWLQVRQGQPPFRPLLGCDQAGPCTWFVYKDGAAAVPAEPAMRRLYERSRP